jgi:hypothetical protein
MLDRWLTRQKQAGNKKPASNTKPASADLGKVVADNIVG